MAIGLPGFGRRFYVAGSLALSVTILASSLIFASRPLVTLKGRNLKYRARRRKHK